MALAVLGGSFDPVHSGHVAMVRHVLDSVVVQKILVIPAAVSPFKSGTSALAVHRLEMARLAFQFGGQVEIDDREIRRGGPSYMVETLEELNREYPGTPLNLIIGADNVPDFSLWHRSEDILSLATVLVLGRHGHPEKLPDSPASSFVYLKGFDQRVSSTVIRAILANGSAVGDLIPPSVYQYIRDNDLYSET